MDRVGIHLKRYRVQAGMTQAELSVAADVLQSRISEYEAGKSMPNIDKLRRLADALGIEPGALLATVTKGDAT